MGNRIIKESICTSEDLNKLSPMAEILFYRLITKVDDYGCFYGNEAIIKSYCFPLRSDEAVPPAAVKEWIRELADAGIIYLYTNDEGTPYMQFVKWAKHQEIRSKKHKFPTFEDTGTTEEQLSANCDNSEQNETSCGDLSQTAANCDNSEQTSANCGLRARARGIQSESNIESNSKKNIESNPNTKREWEEDECFEKFYSAYPKKTGDIRQAYQEYLHVIQSGIPPDVLLEAVHVQFDGITPEDLQYKTSAERWLRNRGWEIRSKGGKSNGRKSAAGKSVSGEVPGEAGDKPKAAGFKYDV